MSDCDFDDGELIDQSDNLLTEAEFFGYQTPKGRQILLSIGNEKALAILINSPATPLAEALELTDELLIRNPNADTEMFTQALMDKGLTFEILEQKPCLWNQLNVLISFVERATDDQNFQASFKALNLIRDSPSLQRANDRQVADLLYVSHRARQTQIEAHTFMETDLDMWILQLTSQIVAHKLNLALLKSKKASYINELVVSFCICIENYEAAWTFLIDFLSASTRIESHSQPIINLLHALEILNPRSISLKALLNSEPEPSGAIREIIKAINGDSTLPDKIKFLKTYLNSDDAVTTCVCRILLERLQERYISCLCLKVEQGNELEIKNVEREVGLRVYEFARYLSSTVQIAGDKLVKTCSVLEAEMRVIQRLRQRVELLTAIALANED